MKFSLDKIFLVLGIIAFPNLFFRGEYNVPLMLFCFACWEDKYKPFIVYVLILSWFVDAYLLFDYISRKQDELAYEQGQKSEVVLVISIIMFTVKIILIVYMIIAEAKCRQAINPSRIGQNIKQLFSFSKKQE